MDRVKKPDTRTVYLIDSENPGGCLEVINSIMQQMDIKDRIILFITHATTVDIKDFALQNQSSVQTVFCPNGLKNSLDFCLTGYLGFLIANNPMRNYVICTDDHGYDNAAAFWNERGKHVSCWHTENSSKPPAKKKTREHTRTDMFPKGFPARYRDYLTHISRETGISVPMLIGSLRTTDGNSWLRSHGVPHKACQKLSRTMPKAMKKKIRKTL